MSPDNTSAKMQPIKVKIIKSKNHMGPLKSLGALGKYPLSPPHISEPGLEARSGGTFLYLLVNL